MNLFSCDEIVLLFNLAVLILDDEKKKAFLEPFEAPQRSVKIKI